MEFLKRLIPSNWKVLVGWAVMMLATSIAAWLGYGTFTPTPPPVPVWIDDDGTQKDVAFGWDEKPEQVQAIAQTLQFKSFGDTEAGKADDPLPTKVYLWQVYRQADPRGPPSKNQRSVGSCVSFGTNNAIIRTMAFEIAVLKKSFELKDIAEEVTYAGSRVEVGGGRISGDGSVGAWAAKFVKEWGVIPREKHGEYDLTTYDESRCRSWGRTGVPDQLEQLARSHPVKTITQVKNWAEAKRALANGYGIAVCSNQGFTMQRDSRGVARASGSWAHCMCLDGYHVEGGVEYGHIENSWGDKSHTGPVGWGDPAPSGFWAESSVIDRMLRQDDSWAFSAVQGFPARELDWFVRLDINRPRELFARRNLFTRTHREFLDGTLRN